MKRLKLRAFVITTIVFLVFFCYSLTTLIVDEPPQESDIIVIPEGSLARERAEKAMELLEQGYSTSGLVMPSPIYLGDDSNNHDLNDDLVSSSIGVRDVYYNVGFTDDQILPESQATSTYTNAVNTLALMDQEGYQSAIVVSSDYHMRRVRYIYEKIIREKNYNFSLTYVAAYHAIDGEMYTWNNVGPRHFLAGVTEVFKMWGYQLSLYHVIDL